MSETLACLNKYTKCVCPECGEFQFLILKKCGLETASPNWHMPEQGESFLLNLIDLGKLTSLKSTKGAKSDSPGDKSQNRKGAFAEVFWNGEFARTSIWGAWQLRKRNSGYQKNHTINGNDSMTTG